MLYTDSQDTLVLSSTVALPYCKDDSTSPGNYGYTLYSSETSTDFQGTTQSYIPEDTTLTLNTVLAYLCLVHNIFRDSSVLTLTEMGDSLISTLKPFKQF
jgi:hypothetical protein